MYKVNIHKLLKIYFFIVLIVSLIIFLLSICGNISRIGYISNLNLNEDDILYKIYKENYIYNFKIHYKSSIFKNSDIYDVFIDTNKLISLNNSISKIIMNEYGSPFGLLFNKDKLAYDNLEIDYKLKIKFDIIFYYTIFLLIFIIFFSYYLLFIKNICNIKDKNKYKFIFSISILIAYILFISILSITLYNKRFNDNIKNIRVINYSNGQYVYSSKINNKYSKIFSIKKDSIVFNDDNIINGYNITITNIPINSWNSTNFYYSDKNTFIINNDSTLDNAYDYGINIPTQKGDIYNLEIVLKQLYGSIFWHLNSANNFRRAEDISYSNEYIIVKDSRKVYSKPEGILSLHFKFPKGITEIESINIYNTNPTLYNEDELVFSSSGDITNTAFSYEFHINKVFIIILLLLIILVIFFNTKINYITLDQVDILPNSLDKKFSLDFVLSSLITVLFILLFSYLKLTDIKIYILSFFILFLIFTFLNNTSFSNRFTSLIDNKIVVLLILFILLVLINKSLYNTILDLQGLGYPQISYGIFSLFKYGSINEILLELLISTLLFILIKSIQNKVTSIIFFIFTVLFIIYCKYYPIILDYFHHNAWFHSVYAVYSGSSFSNDMYSAYGHYAYFALPFFKLFKMNAYSIALFSAILCGLSILFILLTIFHIVKSNFYRILSCLIIIYCFFSMINSYYFAILPLRTFFPSMLIAYAILLSKYKNNIIVNIGGYLISALSIIWNQDTGLVCLASWTFVDFFNRSFFLSLKDKKMYTNIIIVIISSLLSFISSWGIINVFNFLLGGGVLTIKNDLLFPLFTNFSDMLEIKIPSLFHILILQIFIVISVFFYNIKNMRIFNKEINNIPQYSSILILISLIYLGTYTYYINRSAFFNSQISALYFICISIYLLYNLNIYIYTQKEYNNITKYLLMPIFIIGLYMSILLGYLSFGYNDLSNLKKELILKNQKGVVYDEASEIIKKYVTNEGVPEFGIALDYAYINLGWKNSISLPDSPNIYFYGQDNVLRRLMEYDSFFVQSTTGNQALLEELNKNFTNIAEKNKYGIKYYVKK